MALPPLYSPARAGNLPKESSQPRAPTMLQLCDLCGFRTPLSDFLIPSSAQPYDAWYAISPFCRGANQGSERLRQVSKVI